jgi:hypothetical protein
VPQGDPGDGAETWAGDASAPFHFNAPDGVVLRVGEGRRLTLSGGCGEAWLGVLDPDAGTLTADGTLTARRAGPLDVVAEQQGVGARPWTRTQLRVAVVTDAFATATRLLPPAGWTFSDPALAPDGTEASATLLRSAQAFTAYWSANLVPTSRFDLPDRARPEPVVAPPASPGLGSATSLALSMWLAGDEADPVVTHRDAQGLHVVVPNRSPGFRPFTRGFHGIFRVPGGPLDERVLVWRPRKAWPQRVGEHAVPTPVGLPSPAPGLACPPGWAWDGRARALSMDLSQAGGTTGQGFLAAPDSRGVVKPGETIALLARALAPDVRFEVAPAGVAEVRKDPWPIPVAGGPGLATPPPGQPVPATMTVRTTGVLRVRAHDGDHEARALLASVPSKSLAWRLVPSPLVALDPAEATTVRIYRDAASWGAFWRRALPAYPTAPAVDFSRCVVVALTERRTGYGERGLPVLAEVAPGGAALTFVAPGVESHEARPQPISRLTLFLTGRLPPEPKVQLETLCGLEQLRTGQP